MRRVRLYNNGVDYMSTQSAPKTGSRRTASGRQANRIGSGWHGFYNIGAHNRHTTSAPKPENRRQGNSWKPFRWYREGSDPPHPKGRQGTGSRTGNRRTASERPTGQQIGKCENIASTNRNGARRAEKGDRLINLLSNPKTVKMEA